MLVLNLKSQKIFPEMVLCVDDGQTFMYAVCKLSIFQLAIWNDQDTQVEYDVHTYLLSSSCPCLK